MESAVKIRRLVLRNGHSIRSGSRSTGLSRKTIKKHVNDASPPSYHRNALPALHKLAGFEGWLEACYEQDLTRPSREHRSALKLYGLVTV